MILIHGQCGGCYASSAGSIAIPWAFESNQVSRATNCLLDSARRFLIWFVLFAEPTSAPAHVPGWRDQRSTIKL